MSWPLSLAHSRAQLAVLTPMAKHTTYTRDETMERLELHERQKSMARLH